MYTSPFVLLSSPEIIDNSVTVKLSININEQPNLVNLHVIFDDGSGRKVVAEIANVNQTRMIANVVGEINENRFTPGASVKPSFKSKVRLIKTEELELLFGKQETAFGQTNFGTSNVYDGYMYVTLSGYKNKDDYEKITNGKDLDTVDSYIQDPPRDLDKPFLMPVEDVFSITGRGTVATGRIETGKIHVGDEVEILGLGEDKKSVVTGVEMFRKILDEGEAGDNVGLLLRGIDKNEIKRGMVHCHPYSQAYQALQGS